MDAEIHHAAAAGQLTRVVPRLVGAVGVVKREIDDIRRTDAAGAHELCQRVERAREAVREIDMQQPIVLARRLHHAPGFLARAGERLLAEDGEAATQRHLRLFRVERAGRGDHQAVEVRIEQRLE